MRVFFKNILIKIFLSLLPLSRFLLNFFITTFITALIPDLTFVINFEINFFTNKAAVTFPFFLKNKIDGTLFFLFLNEIKNVAFSISLFLKRFIFT